MNQRPDRDRQPGVSGDLVRPLLAVRRAFPNAEVLEVTDNPPATQQSRSRPASRRRQREEHQR